MSWWEPKPYQSMPSLPHIRLSTPSPSPGPPPNYKIAEKGQLEHAPSAGQQCGKERELPMKEPRPPGGHKAAGQILHRTVQERHCWEQTCVSTLTCCSAEWHPLSLLPPNPNSQSLRVKLLCKTFIPSDAVPLEEGPRIHKGQKQHHRRLPAKDKELWAAFPVALLSRRSAGPGNLHYTG